MEDPRGDKITIPLLLARKASGPKIVCLTAYDYPTAKILDEGGVDLILVGDSLGMVVLGYANTVPVTMDEMIHHTQAVSRAAKRALVVGDMPYFSFHLSADETIRNASRFLKEGGAAAVKIEGASQKRLKLVEAMVEAEIPVMGHVGLMPQSIHHLGRYRVKGTGAEEAGRIAADAVNLESAGAFAVVLESVPVEIAEAITRKLKIPTLLLTWYSFCSSRDPGARSLGTRRTKAFVELGAESKIWLRADLSLMDLQLAAAHECHHVWMESQPVGKFASLGAEDRENCADAFAWMMWKELRDRDRERPEANRNW
jgi:3-methyl-2-oxobutanoate hydroxymethyltransferase